MRKIICLIIIFLFCSLTLTACNNNNDEKISDYVSKEEYCVVSLLEDYDIFYYNEEINSATMFDKDLYNAQTVNGKPKKDGLRYYNVLKNEPFRILTPLGIIQNKRASNQTLMYWNLNEKKYKDGDFYYSANVFTCVEDTEITPEYYEFRAVGMLLVEGNEKDNPFVYNELEYESKYFNENGEIIEQEGVYYLYGVYDFEPDREFWRTNLTINNWQVHGTVKPIAQNYSKEFYSINIEIDSQNIFNEDKIFVCGLYKIAGHGYMFYGSTQTINSDNVSKYLSHCMTIGEHEIKYSFSE